MNNAIAITPQIVYDIIVHS